MSDAIVENLSRRCDSLTDTSPVETWRQLSIDVLNALISQQSLVIGLQRRALDGCRDTSLLREATEAFDIVQQLDRLRWRVHATLRARRRPIELAA